MSTRAWMRVFAGCGIAATIAAVGNVDRVPMVAAGFAITAGLCAVAVALCLVAEAITGRRGE